MPVALLAGLLDRRRDPAGGAQDSGFGLVLLGFAFYTTMLSVGVFWPYLLLKAQRHDAAHDGHGPRRHRHG